MPSGFGAFIIRHHDGQTVKRRTMTSPPGTVKVIRDHKPSYGDPIRISRGDVIVLTGRIDNWDSHIWLWAIAPDGRQGWIPDNLLDRQTGVARQNYSAIELACKKGDLLAAEHSSHGWSWCVSPSGKAGWVPNSKLGPAS